MTDAMKTNFWVTGLVTILVTAVVIQHTVIQSHRDRITALEEMLSTASTGENPPAGNRQTAVSPTGPDMTGKAANRLQPGAVPDDPDRESLGQSLRRMSDNPAGRAMMDQGIRAMSAVWFADLVDQFGLTREEEDYFLRLVAGGMSRQQQLGMKMITAETDRERAALKVELEESRETSRNAIRDFLNDDDDFAAYEIYDKQLPERQQIEGLRNTMLEAGAPLSREQEQEVIAAMYKVRTTRVDTTDWQGPGGMEAIASGHAAEKFEREWEEAARVTRAEVAGILEGEQLEAFRRFQNQIKDMQLMSIRMAENMFSTEKDAAPGDE